MKGRYRGVGVGGNEGEGADIVGVNYICFPLHFSSFSGEFEQINYASVGQ